MKQPEHLAGPAFDKARDKMAFLQSRLSEAQQAQYATFVKRQEQEREAQKRQAAKVKSEYDQAKEKRPGAVKDYDPPVKIKDPYLRQMALRAQQEHNKVATLALSQLHDRLRFLEQLEQERIAAAKEAAQEMAAQFRDSAQRPPRDGASPEFNKAAVPAPQAEIGNEFARAAIAGRAETDFQKAAKSDPARQEAIARAIARVKDKEAEERQRADRSIVRERGR